MKSKLILPILLLLCNVVYSQKTAYIANYIRDISTVEGKQFTWTKTAQSANFTIIWGDSVGLDPTKASNPDLRFNPVSVLDTMEVIYQRFKNLGFANESAGTKLSQYKIPIVMYGTYGPSGPQGWANGGDVDGIIGAFWIHPKGVQDGHVVAHELVHSLQMQINIDFRKPNNLWYSFMHTSNLFYETHANFMRNIIYPQDAKSWGMDLYGMESWGQWKNAYENYHLLFAIKEEDGINIINRMWLECNKEEYPIETYKRLSNYTQQELNDKMYKYARRMPTFDFPTDGLGKHLRADRSKEMRNVNPTVQTVYTILKKVSNRENQFFASEEIAPEEYGYNIIPLNPINNSCPVIIKFKGHTESNQYAGWRYGFVTSFADGTISRYSETYSSNESAIGFSLLPGESQMYLVVMGAPNAITTDVNHDTWQGYAKRYRFPYDLTVSGANPEGHQAPSKFRSQLKSDGRLHPNGGGWVSSSSVVDNSVFVAPNAMVTGNSRITGNVKVYNTAMIRDATISDNVIVKDNAFITGGNISGNATISGLAFLENSTVYGTALVNMRARVSNYKLHGNIHVGGDVIVYNKSGDCDNGVYFRMTNYYQDNKLACDNRTALHRENTDVNNSIVAFTNAQMNLDCNCSNYPACNACEVTTTAQALETVNGWTYYGVSGGRNFNFAIEHLPSGSGANTNIFQSRVELKSISNCSPGIYTKTYGKDGIGAIGSYWNIVPVSGNPNGWVNIRFFDNSTNNTAVLNWANNFATGDASNKVSPLIYLKTNQALTLSDNFNSQAMGLNIAFVPTVITQTGKYDNQNYVQFNNISNINNSGGTAIVKVVSLTQNDKVGAIRFNAVTKKIEGFTGTAWEPLH